MMSTSFKNRGSHLGFLRPSLNFILGAAILLIIYFVYKSNNFQRHNSKTTFFVETTQKQFHRISDNEENYSVNKERLYKVLLKDIINDKKWHGRGMNSNFKKKCYFFRKGLQHTVTGGLNASALASYSLSDVMLDWEWRLLEMRPLYDVMDAGSEMTSHFVLLDRKSDYRVGDSVRVRVDVKDGRGNQLFRGGDDVRIFMQEQKKGAFMSTEVQDLGNGSYIADIPLLWAGSPTLKAALSYMKELVRAYQYVRSVFKTIKFIVAVFETHFNSEATLCHTLPILSWYKKMCNLTAENGGIEWYCGHPATPGIGCSHWSYSCEMDFVKELPITKAEYNLSDLNKPKAPYGIFEKNYTINVSKSPLRVYNISKRSDSRRDVNLQSWSSSAPRGHFYNETWIPIDTNKPILADPRRVACLHNTTLFLNGDSNLRIAFEKFSDRTGCKIITGVVKPKWHHPLSCIDEKRSIIIYWQLHALPFHAAVGWRKERSDTKAAVQVLDEIPSVGKYVVMIHSYLHFTAHHYVVFLKHIRAIRQAMDRVLVRNPQVKLIIRGPHMAMKDWNPIRGGDIIAHIYTRIIKREMRGLYDKVYFLQPWDMTVAIQNKGFHPPPMVNNALADMVLDYICLP